MKTLFGLTLSILLMTTPVSAGPLRSAGKAIGKATTKSVVMVGKATAKGAVKVVKVVAKVV